MTLSQAPGTKDGGHDKPPLSPFVQGGGRASSPSVQGGGRGQSPAAAGPAIEPEVLESLDEAERTRFGHGPRTRHIVFTSHPGCGCLAAPFAVVAGVVVSSFLALLWVARALRVIGALGSRISGAFGGRRGPRA